MAVTPHLFCIWLMFCKQTIRGSLAGSIPSVFRWQKHPYMILKLLINTWESTWRGSGILFSKHFLEQLSFGVSIHTSIWSYVTPSTTGKHKRSVLPMMWIILPPVQPQNLTESFICREAADIQSLPAWPTLWRRNVRYEVQVFQLSTYAHTYA